MPTMPASAGSVAVPGRLVVMFVKRPAIVARVDRTQTGSLISFIFRTYLTNSSNPWAIRTTAVDDAATAALPASTASDTFTPAG